MPNTLPTSPTSQPAVPIQQNESIPQEVMDAGLTIKNVEFLDYLGLKNEISNPRVLEKITALSDMFENVDALMEADIKLGQRMDMTKLDKIYSYALLMKQEDELKKKQELISNAKNQWLKQMPSQI